MNKKAQAARRLAAIRQGLKRVKLDTEELWAAMPHEPSVEVKLLESAESLNRAIRSYVAAAEEMDRLRWSSVS